MKDGTREEQWQSGTVEGLEFQEVVEKRRGDFLTWTPTVATGRYSTYFDLRNLYSDFSISERVDPLLNRNGRNTHKLRSDALETTVSVVLYERDAELVRKPKISAEMVEEFSESLAVPNVCLLSMVMEILFGQMLLTGRVSS